MVLNNEQHNAVWDRVKEKLHFFPACFDRNSGVLFPPFVIEQNYVVYGIENTNDDGTEGMESLISKAFIKCTKPEECMYALDWQHSAFLYNPRNAEERQSVFVHDERYLGGGYTAYFPDYYPDGDYYFFISEDFRFGYLTHPWREEAWVFGDELIKEFESFYDTIGWKKLKSEPR